MISCDDGSSTLCVLWFENNPIAFLTSRKDSAASSKDLFSYHSVEKFQSNWPFISLPRSFSQTLVWECPHFHLKVPTGAGRGSTSIVRLFWLLNAVGAARTRHSWDRCNGRNNWRLTLHANSQRRRINLIVARDCIIQLLYSAGAYITRAVRETKIRSS